MGKCRLNRARRELAYTRWCPALGNIPGGDLPSERAYDNFLGALTSFRLAARVMWIWEGPAVKPSSR